MLGQKTGPFIVHKKSQPRGAGPEDEGLQRVYCAEGFTYETWCYIKSIKHEAERLGDFPVERILVEISRVMLLTEFELVFLAYLVERDGWFVEHSDIVDHEKALRLDPAWGPLAQDTNFRLTFLYFLVCAYCVKFYLNETVDHLRDYISAAYLPDFKTFFNKYAKERVEFSFKIKPKELNRKFKLLHFIKEGIAKTEDFNKMASQLISESSHEQAFPGRQESLFDIGNICKKHSFAPD
jgi:hypothetical protein